MKSWKMMTWAGAAACALTLSSFLSSPSTNAATATHSIAAARGGTLTFVVNGSPAALDPSTGDAADEYYFALAYDPLTSYDVHGKYHGVLAKSWKWRGKDFKTIDLHLRPNVKFSNGQAFNAQAVKAWFDVQIQKKTPDWTNLGLASVQIVNPLTVRLHLTAPNPLVPLFLTRTWLSGDIPCPAAAANPAMLKTATCGAGPYMLDTKHTVTGDTYTYIPNPHYWNPSAVYWNKVVLKVVTDPQAAINAVRAGQAQLTWPAQASLIPAALSAGLKDTGVSQNIIGLDFLDKTGAIVPALKDVRVRQALNYAVDRKSLAAAVGGGQGQPISTQFLPGDDGHDAALDNYYSYNVAKAKRLLAAAGYAHGFSLTILANPVAGMSTAAEAVVAYWQAIGVNAKIDSKPQLADFFAGLTSGKYPVATAALGATNPTLLAWNCCFHPGAVWNPQKTDYPALDKLVNKLRVTKATKARPIARQINAYLTKNAWFVPLYSGKLNYLYDPSKVIVPAPSGTQPVVNILDIRPAK